MSATQSVHGSEVTPRFRPRTWIVPLAVPVAIGLIVAIVGLVSNGATSATTPRITSTGQVSSAPATIVTAPVQSRGYVRDPVTHALLPSSVATSRSAIPKASAVAAEPRGGLRDPVSHALLRVPKAASNPAPPIRSNRAAP